MERIPARLTNSKYQSLGSPHFVDVKGFLEISIPDQKWLFGGIPHPTKNIPIPKNLGDKNSYSRDINPGDFANNPRFGKNPQSLGFVDLAQNEKSQSPKPGIGIGNSKKITSQSHL